MQNELQAWDLKTVIQDLVDRAPSIEAISIFGSRARRTNSYRSDIDLLIYTPKALPAVDFAQWMNDEHNPVDLFETNDHQNARSLINGSVIHAVSGSVEEKVDAILLWDRDSGFAPNYSGWIQQTIAGVTFMMTIVRAGDISSTANRFSAELARQGLPDTTLGSGWLEIARSVSEIIERALAAREYLNTNASCINPTRLSIETEYDFQNLIHLVLAPWLPSIEPEPFVIRFNDQEKSADFSLEGNSLVIEAKHIRDPGTKATVLKTLEGLKDFYLRNPNISVLLFLVLVDAGVDIKGPQIEHHYSDSSARVPVLVRVLENRVAVPKAPKKAVQTRKPRAK